MYKQINSNNKTNLFIIHMNRQMLLCRVTLGRGFQLASAMKMAHAPPGHHSVAGTPSNGGLCYPEYVVYRGEQVSDTRTPHSMMSTPSNGGLCYPEYVVYRGEQVSDTRAPHSMMSTPSNGGLCYE